MQDFFETILPNLFSAFLTLPLLIQIIWVIILLEIIMIIASLIYLTLIRKRYQQKNQEQKALTEKYQEILINYIYLTEDEADEKINTKKLLKKAIKNNSDRQIIKGLILTLHNDLSGELADFLEALYYDLDLVKYSLKKMNSSVWYIKIKGIREVTQMKVKDVYTETLKLINHKNQLLRSEAQLTMVKLYQFEGLKFLDTLEFPITEWQQIQLIEEIQSIRNQEVPDLTNWLHSKNDSVICFALKLVRLFNQIQLKDDMIKLVLHPSEKVRRTSISVLGYFKILEAKTVLKQIFKKSSPETQLYIIQALSQLSEKKDIPFFEKQINHPDFDINQIAYNTLKDLKPFLLTVNLNK
ncbi:MAG: HEAT repeat domain-containing protein [Flavobacteriaceae bacterium]|nr:HEAT repeat domain-containing protein [Flavobacteriaceae bacterium]